MTAKQGAQIGQLQSIQTDLKNAISTCSGKGMVYGPTESGADADGCLHAQSPCGDSGMLYGPNHPDADANGCLSVIDECGNMGMLSGPDHPVADANGCVAGLQIGDSGVPVAANGLIVGDQTTCDGDHEGALRYNPAFKTVMFCDGEYWQEIGAAPATSTTFNDISNADPGQTYTTGQAQLSGFFGERTVTATNGALLLVNGSLHGASATVVAGDRVQLRMNASDSFSAAKTTTMSMGSLVTTWTITTRAQDTTPNNFSFNDLTDQELDTLVTSNSVTVSGFDGPLTASVSGQGSPFIRVGGGSWASSVSVEPGQSIQLRLTTSSDFETEYIATVSLGNASVDWVVKTKSDQPPTSCEAPGQQFQGGICATTGANALIAAPSETIPFPGVGWGSHGSYRGILSSTDGRGNTAALVAYGASAHPAASACANLTLGGFNDWYLPAIDELEQLYQVREALDGLGNSWSSTEVFNPYGTHARTLSLASGGRFSRLKYLNNRVRCVRRAN